MPDPTSVAGTPDDPTIQFTPLVLRNQTFHLLFNLQALAKAQKTTGINFLKNGIDLNNLDAEILGRLVHAGLQKAHPALTEEEVMDKVDMFNVFPVTQAIVRAFGVSQMEDDPENPPTPAPAE